MAKERRVFPTVRESPNVGNTVGTASRGQAKKGSVRAKTIASSGIQTLSPARQARRSRKTNVASLSLSSKKLSRALKAAGIFLRYLIIHYSYHDNACSIQRFEATKILRQVRMT